MRDLERVAKARNRPRKPVAPEWTGDHGTGTAAATAGTEMEPIKEEAHNKTARRRRKDNIKGLGLTMRQEQAARAISEAFCKTEMLSSGGPLKEQVDSSPKPDATMAVQVEANSRLAFVMRSVNREARGIVEHICWYNQPISTAKGPLTEAAKRSVFKVAMDLVANSLRY